MKRKLIAISAALVAVAGLSACESDADVASYNISKDADNFKVARRIVFFNGITDQYLLEIQGYCSLGNNDPTDRLSVTCKVDGGYKKHFLGLSDNVSFLVEQLEPRDVSVKFYKVIIKPSVVVPDFEIR